VSKKKPAVAVAEKAHQQAERDCDFIALNGWDWWRSVVRDAEQKANSTAREDAEK